jgi:hypothetical protein
MRGVGPATGVLLGAALLGSALLGSASAAPAPAPIPPAIAALYPRQPCRVDAAGASVRVWWAEGGARGALTGEDGRCTTRPEVVMTAVREVPALLARQARLGLGRPAPDSGLETIDPFRPGRGPQRSDGGSPALDVYVVPQASSGGGVATCVAGVVNRRYRAAAYLVVQPFSKIDAERRALAYRHVLAHELVHVAQCAQTDPRRRTNATELDLRLVEGTAEAIAALTLGPDAVVSGIGDGPAPLGPLMFLFANPQPDRVLAPSRLDDAGEPLGPYRHWPFWVELAQGDARPLRALLAAALRASARDHARGDFDVVYRTFGEGAVHRAVTRMAAFERFGLSLRGLALPAASWSRIQFPLDAVEPADLSLEPEPGTPRRGRLALGVATYAFGRVVWPAGATRLTLSAGGAPAARIADSVIVVDPDLRPVRATGGGTSWILTRGGGAPASVVRLSVGNGRRSPLSLMLTATADADGAAAQNVP